MTQTKTQTDILFLEGNEDSRAVLSTEASRRGVNICCAAPETSLLQQVLDAQPKSLFLDGDLVDGKALAALADIRKEADLKAMSIVLMTEDTSADARARAYDAGADEVLIKPCTLDDIQNMAAEASRFLMTFWGVRGTLPVTGDRSLRYGGNTSCMGLDIGRDRHFIFDAGTGLRSYSKQLLEKHNGKFKGRIFITHPHWDHLNCLPFFAPIYIPGNQISLMGPPQGDRSFKSLVDGQLDGIYFPITVEAFGANIVFSDLVEGDYHFDGVSVKAFHLSHPGYCIGYRIEHADRSVAYITDNELGNIAEGDDYIERLSEFLHGVDVLIHDTSYFDQEYPGKINWGHSSISQVINLAEKAKVKKLFLFHHDPEHGDHELDLKLAEARRVASEKGAEFECLNASEGETWDLVTGKKVLPLSA